MKFTIATTLASFGALVAAIPGTTLTPAGGYGGGGGGGGGSTCYPYTYYFTSSGWTEYPSTIAKTESSPYTKTVTLYKTYETQTCVPTKIVKEIYSTSTGYALTTKSSVTKIKTGWTSTSSKVTSTCKSGGGGGGGGGYGSY